MSSRSSSCQGQVQSLTLEIFANKNEKIGELEIGRGSLFWYGRNRREQARQLVALAEMMDVLAYGEHLPAAEK